MATLEENKTTLKNDNPKPLYKNVNGNRIELTDSEYDAQIEEWATNMTTQQSKYTVIKDGGTHADYKQIRKEAYLKDLGDWGDQLDMIYHDIDGWKAKVKTIKDKYTKP